MALGWKHESAMAARRADTHKPCVHYVIFLEQNEERLPEVVATPPRHEDERFVSISLCAGQVANPWVLREQAGLGPAQRAV